METTQNCEQDDPVGEPKIGAFGDIAMLQVTGNLPPILQAQKDRAKAAAMNAQYKPAVNYSNLTKRQMSQKMGHAESMQALMLTDDFVNKLKKAEFTQTQNM